MTRLFVPDMTCGHCKASVEAALATVPGAGPVTVDLQNHWVETSGDVTVVVAALARIGFPAQPIDAA